MSKPNEIIEFTKVIIQKASIIDDLIDKSLDSLKDYTDTIEDIVTPVKSIFSIITLSKKISIKSFIKNYAKSLSDNYVFDSNEVKRLEKYFEKIENLKMVSEIIDSAISAKSVKASSILGVMAGKILKNKTELNDSDLVVVASLKEMTDIDLYNFVVLFENIGQVYLQEISNKKTLFDTEFRTRVIYGTENWRPINIERTSLELTIEKLKRTGALTYSGGGMDYVGNAKGAFMFSKITEDLYDLIKKSKIE